MYLLIFESIGTSELVLVGIVALIFLGPRRLPEIARKAGKMMSDFRSTTDEFKQTWQREVDFEEEAKALRMDEIEKEVVAREKQPAAPTVGEVDAEEFQRRLAAAPTLEASPGQENTPIPAEPIHTAASEDKRNWL